jgi:chromosome segregation ATPase
MHGDKEVHPRPVCVPWSNLLLVSNQELSQSVTHLSGKAQRIEDKAQARIDAMQADVAAMEKSGLKVRTELVQLKNEMAPKDKLIAQLQHDVEQAEAKQREAWEELKKVQNYRKGKKRHEERLAKVLASEEKLRARIKTLEESNTRLTREDMSKTEIISQLEGKLAKLMSERASEAKPPADEAAAQADAQ